MQKIALAVGTLLMSAPAEAQNICQTIFAGICTNIIIQEKNYKLKERLADVFLVVDPITGNEQIIYPKTPGDSLLIWFKKLSVATQKEILHADSMLLFPLGDTIHVIDSIYFFRTASDFASEGHYFKIHHLNRRYPNPKSTLCLTYVGLKEDEMTLH